MNRRRFLLATLGLPALAGCELSFEQGLFGDCRAPLDMTRSPLVDAAWQGLDPQKVWDMHAHVFGNGRSGSGIWLDPALDRPRTPQGYARRTFFMNAGCVGDDEERFDQRMVQRLELLVDRAPRGMKVLLLAFDFSHDEHGRRLEDRTTFAVPDDYVRRVAVARPDRFEWGASIHPYREDAIERLEAAAKGGARLVKWLPPSMGIDLAHPKCRAFYEACRRLAMPLLIHVGEERAAPGAGHGALDNPLLLRHPLERGVRVIAAHCATMGMSADIDAVPNAAKAPQAESFALFGRLMAEPRYEKLLYGDISAVPQTNRVRYLPQLLARTEWHPRLLNGSDYPLPGVMPLFSLKGMVSAGLIGEAAARELAELRHGNALLFDLVLKRHLRHRGQAFPASVFETRDFFTRHA